MHIESLIRLDGNVAHITGASGSFGAASAMTLAAGGAHGAGHGWCRRQLQPVADEIGEQGAARRGRHITTG